MIWKILLAIIIATAAAAQTFEEGEKHHRATPPDDVMCLSLKLLAKFCQTSGGWLSSSTHGDCDHGWFRHESLGFDGRFPNRIRLGSHMKHDA